MQTVTTGASSLAELAVKYANDEDCVGLLESLRWPDGPRCPKCDCARAYDISKRKVYECGECQFQYSVTTGTVMHSTKLPLVKWIMAAALLSNARKGVSSCQMARDLHVTQRTAWYLGHRLRKAMRDTDWLRKFTGICEMDETFLGGSGKRRGKPRGRGTDKTIIFGVRQRGGHVTMRVIPEATGKQLSKAVHECVDKSAHLMADSFPAYNQLHTEFRMDRINHMLSYVKGEIHTQSIESIWAILKRQYHGTHHHVTAGYLPLYLAEISYRFSHRMNPSLFSMILGNGLVTDRMVLNQRPTQNNGSAES